MRLVFILSIFFFGSCATKKSEKATQDCSRFHNGMFYLQQKPDSIFFHVSRNSSIQTEYDPVTDTLATFDIVWNNSCEYSIKLINRRKMTNTDTSVAGPPVEVRDAIPVTVKITASGSNYFVFEAQRKGMDEVFSDTMWVRQ